MTGKAVSCPIHKGTTELQRQADMRIKLMNVECEFRVSVVSGRRNVYVTAETAVSTSDMKTPHFAFVRRVTDNSYNKSEN